MGEPQPVDPAPGGIPIHPDRVPTPAKESEDGNGKGDDGRPNPPPPPPPPLGLPKDVFAVFQLDPVRAIRQLGDILDDVANRLSGSTEIALEI